MSGSPRTKKPEPSRRDLLRWAAAGTVASVLPVGFTEVDTRMLEVTEHNLALPLWDADGLRVAVVSDFHVNSEEETLFALAAAQAAIEQRPNFILLPGDFVNYSDSRRISNVRRVLRAFADARCPVFATLGNHDYRAAKPERIVQSFEDSPVRLLRNRVVDVDGVTIAGLDDALANRYRPDTVTSANPSKSLIVMLHEPDYVDEVPGHVSLQVSGHSHGGQICLPMGIPLHTPGGAKRYVDGYYPEAHVPLFVTRGVGTTGVRYRLFCRPQVAVLTLNSA